MKALSPIFIFTFVVVSVMVQDKRLILLSLLAGIAAHYLIHLLIYRKCVILSFFSSFLFITCLNNVIIIIIFFLLFLKNDRFAVPKDTAVLITGCSTGIGEDAALTFSDLGFYVFATVRYIILLFFIITRISYFIKNMPFFYITSLVSFLFLYRGNFSYFRKYNNLFGFNVTIAMMIKSCNNDSKCRNAAQAQALKEKSASKEFLLPLIVDITKENEINQAFATVSAWYLSSLSLFYCFIMIYFITII